MKRMFFCSCALLVAVAWSAASAEAQNRGGHLHSFGGSSSSSKGGSSSSSGHSSSSSSGHSSSSSSGHSSSSSSGHFYPGPYQYPPYYQSGYPYTYNQVYGVYNQGAYPGYRTMPAQRLGGSSYPGAYGRPSVTPVRGFRR